jgi:hypothetical protein
MHFGLGVYYPQTLSQEGQTLTGAVHEFADYVGSGSVWFQGMKADTDRYTPARILSGANANLADRLHLYSDLLAFAPNRREPTSQLSLAIRPRSDAAYRFGFFQAQIEDSTEIAGAVRFAKHLTESLESPYAFSVFGSNSTIVLSELSATPIRAWDAPGDPDDDERLIQIQHARHLLGDQVRGGSWGLLLGARLVSRLGGERRVRTEAPVELVEVLREGRLYLQLSSQSLLLESREYREKVRPLTDYLHPITAGGLQG